MARIETRRRLIVVAAVALLAVGASVYGLGPASAATGTDADLRVSAPAGAGVVAGEPFERHVVVRNAGDAPARDVHVIAELPPGVRIATMLPELPGGTCTVVSVGGPAGRSLLADCARNGLGAGEAVTLRLPLVTAAPTPCGPLVTAVRVSAANEPRTAVDAGNVVRVVDHLDGCQGPPGPDLTLSAETIGRQPLPGRSSFIYRIEVTNRGDADAHDVRVAASLPVGVTVRGAPDGPEDAPCTVVSSAGSDGPARWSAGCALEELAPGATAVVEVTGRVDPDPRCVDARVVATVRADDEPRALRGTENRATTSLGLACEPRLAVSVPVPAAAHLGSAVPVTVHVRNVSGARVLSVRVGVGGCGTDVRRVVGGDGDRILGPRERWTFRCRRPIGGNADPAPVRVVAVGRDGARQVAVARATRRIDVWHPAIALGVTTAAAGGERPGGRAAVTATVRNAGDAPLTDIVLAVAGTRAAGPDLPPGGSAIVTIDVVLPRGSEVPVTVSAVDRLGGAAKATETLVLRALASDDAGGLDAGDDARGAPGTRGGASAFTGAAVTLPGTLTVALIVLGIAAAVVGRRRGIGEPPSLSPVRPRGTGAGSSKDQG